MNIDNVRTQSKLLDVLLVEDDPGDTVLVQDFFDTHHTETQLHLVGDGAEAVDFLHRRGAYHDAPRPDLILLDLNMPRMDGREFLNTIKPDEQLGAIPVVVFTTSAAADDITLSYVAGANAYITKPVDFDSFRLAVGGIYDFFARTAALPRRTRPETRPVSEHREP